MGIYTVWDLIPFGCLDPETMSERDQHHPAPIQAEDKLSKLLLELNSGKEDRPCPILQGGLNGSFPKLGPFFGSPF